MAVDDICALIEDIKSLSKQVDDALILAKSVKSKTLVFESDLGFPSSLVRPLYSASVRESSDGLHDLELKIKSDIELGDMMHACALQSILIAKLYILNSIDIKTLSAISDLADMYYSRKLYDQASDHSCTLLKHISTLPQNNQTLEFKIKAYFLIARGNISQKKFNKASDLLKKGVSLSTCFNISSDKLDYLYVRTMAELFDSQNLYLLALEKYSEILEKKLYTDENDHLEILLRMNQISGLSSEMEKSLMYLKMANELNDSLNPRDISKTLKLKILLINQLRKEDVNHALEIAEESTLNTLKYESLNGDELNFFISLGNHYVQMLIQVMKFEQALSQQKILNNLLLEHYGPDSIKFTLNQIQTAQILQLIGKPNLSLSLFKKTIHNKRFRDHLRHKIFENKFKTLFDTFDNQLQTKLLSDYRDIQKMGIKCA